MVLTTKGKVKEILIPYVESMGELVAAEAELDREVHGGRLNTRTVKEEIIPRRDELRQQMRQTRTEAREAVEAAIREMLQTAGQDDEIKGADMTDDAKLLSCGIALTKEDLTAILRRNRDNHTMQTLVQRYAKDHGIVLGVEIPSATNVAQEQAANLRYLLSMYIDHWIQTNKAMEMLNKLFG